MMRVWQAWVVGFIGVALVQNAFLCHARKESADCFKAVFAFGDGMFDTGSISSIFPSLLNYDYPPYGSAHFGKPSGRFSDGRIVLDFLCEALGLPKLPSYAQTVTSDFSKGVTFGSAFSTIGTVKTGQTAGPFMFLNPFSLHMQVQQYVEFKATTGRVHASKTIPNYRILAEEEKARVIDEGAHAKARLPAGADFSTGLYLVSTGLHDIVNFYNQNYTAERIEGKFSDLISKYGSEIRTLAKSYHVKNILIFDVEPLGCQPFLLTLLPHTDADLDRKGCLIAVNGLVQKFNRQLRKAAKSWRATHKANIVVVSQYNIKISLINDAESGFNVTNSACCGVPGSSPYNVNIVVPCGPPGVDPRTTPPTPMQATACATPSSHLYFDGFYTTEAANKYIVERILSGDHFDVPFDTLTSCATPLS